MLASLMAGDHEHLGRIALGVAQAVDLLRERPTDLLGGYVGLRP
jgi:hypothetical protein